MGLSSNGRMLSSHGGDGGSSPPRSTSSALVAEQRGTRLQPVPTRCDSGRALDMYATTPIGANGLAAWWFSHSYCGEFDSLDPDDTPIWCSDWTRSPGTGERRV